MSTPQKKVLIADDDLDDVEFLKEAFDNVVPSAEFVSVPDGIAALRHIKTASKPDIVFLDLNMPLKNGLNCLKDIYNLDLLPGIPIIIYSTSNNIKDIDEAYKHNAFSYIIKPESFRTLCRMIAEIIEKLSMPPNGRISKENFVLTERKISKDDFLATGNR